MIKLVVREHHFPPAVIDAFFLDDADYHGLEFWVNDTIELIKARGKKR
jgi:hypothetical protein